MQKRKLNKSLLLNRTMKRGVGFGCCLDCCFNNSSGNIYLTIGKLISPMIT